MKTSIQNVLSTQTYDVFSRLRNEERENTRDAFSAFISEAGDKQAEDEAVQSEVISGSFADNGVKSTVMIGRLFSQKPQHGSDATTCINLTEEDKQLWCNGGPEGTRFVNAGGGTYKGTDWRLECQCSAHYDINSSGDAPIMYVFEYNVNDPIHNEPVLLKIDVNKIDPSNATYEEMIALAGYIYRDDPQAASEACDAIDMARIYMKLDGKDWQNGTHDYTSYYLPEVVRRNKDYPNPANKVIAKAAESLLEYLKYWPQCI